MFTEHDLMFIKIRVLLMKLVSDSSQTAKRLNALSSNTIC
jgi:hypothetical protein